MITQVKKYLTNIAIGMRFGPSFSVCDDFGKIADQLLYVDDSFFNKKLFPNIVTLPFQIRLENPKTGDYLSLSQTDLILNCNFDDTIVKPDLEINPKIKIDKLGDINEGFKKLLDGLRDYDFDRIQRIGYVNRYIFNVEGLTKVVTDTIIGKTIDGVSDIALRFSKRYPVADALSKKNINNYHNVIYTIEKKPSKEELGISLDYQEFYEPNLSGTNNINFNGFVSMMENYNKETFPKWLSKLGEK